MAVASIAFFILLAVGIAAFCFYRAARGYRDGRARLDIRGIMSLDSDRDDDSVGFSTAVWGNVAMGLFLLACAVWILFTRG